MSYGEPGDVPGECNAWLFIFDNFGDNHATMRCQLPEGHEGPHSERFRPDQEEKGEAYGVMVQWEGDDHHYMNRTEACLDDEEDEDGGAGVEP